ncbi:hypothetical protein Landi51_00537 [Colletotrichum acutatum]
MSSDTDPVFDQTAAAPMRKKTFKCPIAGCIFNVDKSIFFEDVRVWDAHVAEHLTCPYFFCREKYPDQTSMKEHETKHDKANDCDFGCSWPVQFEADPHWRCRKLKDNGEVCHKGFKKNELPEFEKHLREAHKVPLDDVFVTITESEVMMNGKGFWCRLCGDFGEAWSNDDERLPKYGNEPWAWVFRFLDHVSAHSISTKKMVGDAEDTDEGRETDDV